MSITFTWDELVTEELVESLRVTAGVATFADVTAVVGAVARTLESSGNLPVLPGVPSAPERTALARGLLERAFQRVVGEMGLVRSPEGTLRRSSGTQDVEFEILAQEAVHVNVADEATLEALPVVGPALARRVVDERLAHGSYRSMDDLVERVHGLGESAKDELSGVLSFLVPVVAEGATTRDDLELEPLLGLILARLVRATPESKLLAALHMAAVICASTSALVAPAQLAVEESFPELPSYEADLVVPLLGARYYFALIEMLNEAETSIAVCMFHAALPDDDHPTRKILDALAAARERGVDVRVLLDRDREGDPYRSSVINTAAKAHLEAAGVSCRFDSAEVLLHSKFVILDEDTVVIGSHNWSAGSYFQFDDASVAITCASYAAVMRARFDQMWTAAEPA